MRFSQREYLISEANLLFRFNGRMFADSNGKEKIESLRERAAEELSEILVASITEEANKRKKLLTKKSGPETDRQKNGID